MRLNHFNSLRSSIVLIVLYHFSILFPVQEVEEELTADSESIDALELGLSIPPGRWRKGNTHPNSDGILLRFRPKESKKSDGPQRLPQPVFGKVSYTIIQYCTLRFSATFLF